MKLINTSLGEIYNSLSTREISDFNLYIKKSIKSKETNLLNLHELMINMKSNNSLKDYDYDYIKQKMFNNVKISPTMLTTYVNLLSNNLKEFLILSKIREKNIYTEILWGELLIERKLDKNLMIKQNNFKIDYLKDQYPLLKSYYHHREKYFNLYNNFTTKKFKVIIHSFKDLLESFEEYYLISKIEKFISYFSNIKLRNEIEVKIDAIDVENTIRKGIESQNQTVNIYALTLKLYYEFEDSIFSILYNKFIELFNELSNETINLLFSTLYNFSIVKINEGNEYYSKENYRLLTFLFKKDLLFTREFYTLVRFNNFLTYEIKYGNVIIAEKTLEENINLVQLNQRDSFYSLNKSKIEFLKENYSESLKLIQQINPKDSLYFFPLYKIQLIKNYVMLNDVDRVGAEKENFYKYIYENSSITNEAKNRYKIFIKYIENIAEYKFFDLTEYMKKRMNEALLETSIYFNEKEWIRERWEQLNFKFS